MKIRKGDTVQILAGKDRGKRGRILSVNPSAQSVVVEGLNMKKKHTRPRRAGQKGQVIEFPGALPVARVALMCPNCQRAVRIGFRLGDDGKKVRWCRRCSSAIPAVR